MLWKLVWGGLTPLCSRLRTAECSVRRTRREPAVGRAPGFCTCPDPRRAHGQVPCRKPCGHTSRALPPGCLCSCRCVSTLHRLLSPNRPLSSCLFSAKRVMSFIAICRTFWGPPPSVCPHAHPQSPPLLGLPDGPLFAP